MPVYEYFCPTCNQRFEVMRPMSRSHEPASCEKGHVAGRVLSRFASFARDAEGFTAPISGSGDSCGSCSSGNCGSCGI